MNYFAFGKMLPKWLSVPLFGDRERFGRTPDVEDASWKVWRRLDVEFYDQNQRRSVGAIVNGMGYRVMRRTRLEGHGCMEPDKIISWEHPNFADGILSELHRQMGLELASFRPMGVPIIDVNQVARFIFRKC